MYQHAIIYGNKIYAVSSDLVECIFQATENMFKDEVYKSSLSGTFMYATTNVKPNTQLSDYVIDGNFIE